MSPLCFVLVGPERGKEPVVASVGLEDLRIIVDGNE
jgi:ribosomal protein L24